MIEIIQGNQTTWEKDVRKVLSLFNFINKYSKGFFRYISTYYTVSNENLLTLDSEFYSAVAYGKILSVSSSGDNVFSHILNEATQIDLFDINKMSYYILALKKGAIKSLNRLEYLSLVSSLTGNYALENGATIYLNEAIKNIEEEDARCFWEELMKSLGISQLRELARTDIGSKAWTEKFVLYYATDLFDKLRNLIDKTEIKFYLGNLEDASIGTQNYDFIYYSNIFEYIHSISESMIVKKSIPKLSENGVLVWQGLTDKYNIEYYKELKSIEYKCMQANNFTEWDETSTLHTITRKK